MEGKTCKPSGNKDMQILLIHTLPSVLSSLHQTFDLNALWMISYPVHLLIVSYHLATVNWEIMDMHDMHLKQLE